MSSPALYLPYLFSRGSIVRLFALVLLLSGFSRAADEADLRAAFETHRWFDLRDAVTSRKAPPLYRLLVAAAFNDARCAENELSAVNRSAATREQLSSVHYALYRLYRRS